MTSSLALGLVSTKRARIAKLAKQMPGTAIRSLSHHMDLEWMREAYSRTRKSGAVGVDGRTADAFAEHLDDNLRSLLEQAKSGSYRAPPVRRVHIPKGDGGSETRPIGVPTFGDKVLQRAVAMLLEPIYEEDFYDFSYGFRRGRSAHDALEALDKGLWRMGGGWVIDMDVQRFFDSMDHGELRGLVRQRVVDGVVTRLIGKWLCAGVLQEGRVHRPSAGSPQGGVISPVFANVYLHHVLDQWWAETVVPRLRGRAFLVRYADDAVLVFSDKRDAERVHAVLPKRFARFGLTVHPEKTPAGPVPSSAAGWERAAPREFRFPGFHPLLGEVAQGPMGSEAQDGLEAVLALAASGQPGDAARTPCFDPGTVQDPRTEAPRVLRLLRDTGQLAIPECVPARSASPMEEMAEPAFPQSVGNVGGLRPDGPAIPVAAPANAEAATSTCEAVIRGAECVNCACSDL